MLALGLLFGCVAMSNKSWATVSISRANVIDRQITYGLFDYKRTDTFDGHTEEYNYVIQGIMDDDDVTAYTKVQDASNITAGFLSFGIFFCCAAAIFLFAIENARTRFLTIFILFTMLTAVCFVLACILQPSLKPQADDYVSGLKNRFGGEPDVQTSMGAGWGLCFVACALFVSAVIISVAGREKILERNAYSTV
jgi:hypothetical protein